jgi:hypothetical protein
MSAYLIVDVDDLLEHLQRRSFAIDHHELATKLRNSAALVAGLPSPDDLRAVAVANWHEMQNMATEGIFQGVGFEIVDSSSPEHTANILMINIFNVDPTPVEELILVGNGNQLVLLSSKVKMNSAGRIRVWGEQKPDIPLPGVIYQPLESVLGIQSKTVSLYIDFENIAISLIEQGFAINIDKMISSLSHHAMTHGQVMRMAAYAPWGQRGTLPPLVDGSGRDISDEAQSRLALASIDPVFNLPGKNSADMRIARDLLADSTGPNTPDIFIIASGDRDFNDVLNALRSRNKQVIVWGVRGSTSRQLEHNPAYQIEYLDDFLGLQRYQAVGQIFAATLVAANQAAVFTPNQWTSVILQFDRLATRNATEHGVPLAMLQEQLRPVSAAIPQQKAFDLVTQAIQMGILQQASNGGVEYVRIIGEHNVVEKTRLIRDRVVMRVANTLDVRGWEYVNYGFLLKGLTMDKDLELPGLNINDTWRSEWVDCLVREGILYREMVPHRHNPEDLAPVIRLGEELQALNIPLKISGEVYAPSYDDLDVTPLQVQRDLETSAMMRRVIISVDQFTSYRNFSWCPLGSLHRRLRDFDSGVTFQRAVEWLMELGAVAVDEYDNPQSSYKTKGISLNLAAAIVSDVLRERNNFIRLLLRFHDQRTPINLNTVSTELPITESAIELWLSIMEAENVLNPVPGKAGAFTLFRAHHTVNLVADTKVSGGSGGSGYSNGSMDDGDL